MHKQDLLYEGKAKKIYSTTDPDRVIVQYKDDATAFNGVKKAKIADKGILNNKISNIFFQLLEEEDIPTHSIELLNPREVLAKKLDIIMIEVVMRNIAAGSLVKRLGLKEGTILSRPILEFYYKDDDLGDPMINDYHIYSQKIASKEELDIIKDMAFKINQILVDYLKDKGIDLVDFKLEFGRGSDGKVYLGDEISPDNCRFWDSKSKKKLDKDRFRQGMGGVEGAYQEILSRLTSNE